MRYCLFQLNPKVKRWSCTTFAMKWISGGATAALFARELCDWNRNGLIIQIPSRHFHFHVWVGKFQAPVHWHHIYWRIFLSPLETRPEDLLLHTTSHFTWRMKANSHWTSTRSCTHWVWLGPDTRSRHHRLPWCFEASEWIQIGGKLVANLKEIRSQWRSSSRFGLGLESLSPKVLEQDSRGRSDSGTPARTARFYPIYFTLKRPLELAQVRLIFPFKFERSTSINGAESLHPSRPSL